MREIWARGRGESSVAFGAIVFRLHRFLAGMDTKTASVAERHLQQKDLIMTEFGLERGAASQ
jgi:hypothetical protein